DRAGPGLLLSLRAATSDDARSPGFDRGGRIGARRGVRRRGGGRRRRRGAPSLSVPGSRARDGPSARCERPMATPAEIGPPSPLGEAYLEGRLAQARLSGEFRPSRRKDVPEIERLDPRERSAAIARGIAALRRGEVGYGVLAAGASTRMNLAEVP